MRKTLVIISIICLSVILFSCLLSAAEKIIVINERANIRLKPDLKSNLICTVSKGTILEFYEKTGEWYKVNLPPDKNGLVVTGYIHSSVVEIVTKKVIPEKPVSSLSESAQIDLLSKQQINQISPARGFGIGVKLLGGMSYLSVKDINDGVKGYNDRWVYCNTTLYGWTAHGEVKPIHYGPDFAGDIIINFTHKFGVQFGTGYIQGAKTSETSLTKGTTEDIATYKPRVSAIPIRLGIFYNILISRTVNVVLNSGGGWYFTKYHYDYFRESDNGYIWYKQKDRASANGPGFFGGIGLEFKITSKMAFILESQGRYAKISGFEGTYEYTSSHLGCGKGEGTLYYMLSSEKWPYVFICREKPGAPYTNVREARVDFSGFTIRSGLKIRF